MRKNELRKIIADGKTVLNACLLSYGDPWSTVDQNRLRDLAGGGVIDEPLRLRTDRSNSGSQTGADHLHVPSQTDGVSPLAPAHWSQRGLRDNIFQSCV